MGFQKFKRPILDPAGLQIGSSHSSGKRWGGGGSTFAKDVVFSSTLAQAAPAGLVESVQTISLSGASGNYKTAPIEPRGVTFITSTGTGAGWNVTLANPGKKGAQKKVFVFLSGASTVPVTVRTASSSNVFFGSTKNSISVTTAAGSTWPVAFEFVGFTSKRWALLNVSENASTALPVISSTGSTKSTGVAL